MPQAGFEPGLRRSALLCLNIREPMLTTRPPRPVSRCYYFYKFGALDSVLGPLDLLSNEIEKNVYFYLELKFFNFGIRPPARATLAGVCLTN